MFYKKQLFSFFDRLLLLSFYYMRLSKPQISSYRESNRKYKEKG